MSLNEDLLKVVEFVEEQGLFARYRAEIGEEKVSLWVSCLPLTANQTVSLQTQLRLFAQIDHVNLPTVLDFFCLRDAQQWTPDQEHPSGSFCVVVDEMGVQGCQQATDPLVKLAALISALAELHVHGFAHGALTTDSLFQESERVVLWGFPVFSGQAIARGIGAIQSDLCALAEIAEDWLPEQLSHHQKLWLKQLQTAGELVTAGEAGRRARSWLQIEDSALSFPPIRATHAGQYLHALRPIRLVGRQAELSMLENALGGAEREEAVYTVVLHGAPGSGRSHLCEHFCRRMHREGKALFFRASHRPFPTPTDGISGMLAEFFQVDLRDLEGTRHRIEEGLAGLNISVSEQAPGIESFVREHFDGKPLTLRKRSTRFALLQSFMEALTAHQPVILWVDDAQWGSDILNFCEFLRERDTGVPLLIILSVREGWPSEVVRGAAGLTVPRQGPRTLWMPIEPLSMPEALSLATDSLGLEEDLAALVAGGSRGLPLIASQSAILWQSQDLLTVGVRYLELVGTKLPLLKTGTRQVWAQRLANLIGDNHDDLIRLELAAAFGVRIDLDLWASACELLSIGLPDDFSDRLIRGGLVKETQGGWSFFHESFKSFLDHSAEREGRRIEQHKACAKALMSSGRPATAQHWERIGRHLLAGGQGDASLPALRRAARLHGAQANHEAALGILVIRDKVMRDLAVDSRDERWGYGRVIRADMLRGAGRLDEAARIVDQVVDDAQGNRWKGVMPLALRSLALVALEMEDISSASTLLRRARELFEVDGDHASVASCAKWQGRVLLRRGNQASAERFFLDAAERFEQVQNPLEQAACLFWAGVVLRQQGKVDSAMDVLEKAEQLYGKHGDWIGEADSKQARGLVLLYRGDLDGSEALQRTAFELHSRLQHDVGAADCLNGLAEIARLRGDLEVAERNYRSAAAILSSARASRAVLPQVNLALILIQRDELDGARKLLESISPSIERQGKRALLGAVHALFLVVSADDSESLSWARHYRKATSLLQETGAVDPDIAWAAQYAGERAAACGNVDRAGQAYALAHDQWARLQRDEEASAVTQALLALDEST